MWIWLLVQLSSHTTCRLWGEVGNCYKLLTSLCLLRNFVFKEEMSRKEIQINDSGFSFLFLGSSFNNLKHYLD